MASTSDDQKRQSSRQSSPDCRIKHIHFPLLLPASSSFHRNSPNPSPHSLNRILPAVSSHLFAISPTSLPYMYILSIPAISYFPSLDLFICYLLPRMLMPYLPCYSPCVPSLSHSICLSVFLYLPHLTFIQCNSPSDVPFPLRLFQMRN